MLPHVWEFVTAVQFSFGLLCMVRGLLRFLKINDCPLCESGCVKKHKPSFRTFGQVNSKSVLKSWSLFRFKSFISKQCEYMN